MAQRTLAATCILLLPLAGCSLTGKTDAPQAEAARPASAKESIAQGKPTAAPGRYVDPTVAKAAAPHASDKAKASETAATAPALDSPFPPVPATPQQASIAGLATQPTGVRANSGTIFSAAPPAAVAAPASASGPVPADLPRRNFNAMTASVYSAPRPVAASACGGTDAQGNPISC